MRVACAEGDRDGRRQCARQCSDETLRYDKFVCAGEDGGTPERPLRLENHVLYAIDDYKSGRLDAGLMHACMALDGTAKKIFGLGGKSNYKKCLRRYYWILDFMLGGGPDIGKSVWSNLTVSDGHGRKINEPDLADIIYHVFRCSHAHSDTVPEAYSLTLSEDGHCSWFLAKEEFHMPDRVVWGLLSISVFAKVNSDIKTNSIHELLWGSDRLGLGFSKFPIRDWWGQELKFREFSDARPQVKVAMIDLDRLV